MFGDIESFSDKARFDSHRYGNLYMGGKNYGLAFFAYVHTDAYDIALFTPNVSEGTRQAYLDDLLSKAIYERDIGVTTEDCLVLLSTCSSSSTNGRDILVGKILDEAFANPFENTGTNDENTRPNTDESALAEEIRIWPLLLIILLMALLLKSLSVMERKLKRKKQNGKRSKERADYD